MGGILAGREAFIPDRRPTQFELVKASAGDVESDLSSPSAHHKLEGLARFDPALALGQFLQLFSLREVFGEEAASLPIETEPAVSEAERRCCLVDLVDRQQGNDVEISSSDGMTGKKVGVDPMPLEEPIPLQPLNPRLIDGDRLALADEIPCLYGETHAVAEGQK